MKNKNINIIISTLLVFSVIGNIILGFQIYGTKNAIQDAYNGMEESSNQTNEDKKADTMLDSNSFSDNEDEVAVEIQQISLNEQVTVNTIYGDFDLIIEHVKSTDWLEDRDEGDEFQAVFIECDIQNISFTDPYNNIFWIDHYLNVLDDTNYVVEELGYSLSDGEYIGTIEIPIGAGAKIVTGYQVKKGVEKLEIIVNDQYRLDTEIEF